VSYASEVSDVSARTTMSVVDDVAAFVRLHYCAKTRDAVYFDASAPLEDQLYHEFRILTHRGSADVESVFKLMIQRAKGHAGRIGNRRGNLFNALVFDALKIALPDNDRFTIRREAILRDESAFDVLVHDTQRNRYLGVYAQLSLWGGGHQSQRRKAYLSDAFHNGFNSAAYGAPIKVVILVCNDPHPMRPSVALRELHSGILSGRLAYITQLQSICSAWFDRGAGDAAVEV